MKPTELPSFGRGLTALVAGALWFPTAALAQGPPIDDIAVAVRDQGYTCDEPQSAEEDPAVSSPEEKAWILHCEDRSYRVKFLGDAGASVEPLAE